MQAVLNIMQGGDIYAVGIIGAVINSINGTKLYYADDYPEIIYNQNNVCHSERQVHIYRHRYSENQKKIYDNYRNPFLIPWYQDRDKELSICKDTLPVLMHPMQLLLPHLLLMQN